MEKEKFYLPNNKVTADSDGRIIRSKLELNFNKMHQLKMGKDVRLGQ